MKDNILITPKVGEPYATNKTKITMLDWGIRFVTNDDTAIVTIPWHNIKIIEEKLV